MKKVLNEEKLGYGTIKCISESNQLDWTLFSQSILLNFCFPASL